MCASYRPSADTYRRAYAMGLPSWNPCRRYGTGGDGWLTWSPHGPEPYAPESLAAGQDESSKPGCSQPPGAVCAALKEASVTTSRGSAPDRSTCSRPRTPAGPSVVLTAWIAMVFVPECSADVTSSSRACFQMSAVCGDASIFLPLTHRVNWSSAVRVNCPFVIAPEPRSTVRRR